MDVQKHVRTQQIKKLSRYLYLALSGFRYLLYLGWLAIAAVAFLPEGDFYLGDTLVVVDAENSAFKWVILLLYAGGLFIILRINHHFRELMKHFMAGQIFSYAAIGCVRGALKGGIAFVVMSSLQALIGSVYDHLANATLDLSFSSEIVIAAIYFGLMYTLLWALEIGCDLNDESAMTI